MCLTLFSLGKKAKLMDSSIMKSYMCIFNLLLFLGISIFFNSSYAGDPPPNKGYFKIFVVEQKINIDLQVPTRFFHMFGLEKNHKHGFGKLSEPIAKKIFKRVFETGKAIDFKANDCKWGYSAVLLGFGSGRIVGNAACTKKITQMAARFEFFEKKANDFWIEGSFTNVAGKLAKFRLDPKNKEAALGKGSLKTSKKNLIPLGIGIGLLAFLTIGWRVWTSKCGKGPNQGESPEKEEISSSGENSHKEKSSSAKEA